MNIASMYGSMVFNDTTMRARLPKDVYKALRKTIVNGTHLELDVANCVANAMKDWACEKGATHFTHWFQPLTGSTAEKHDSFICPDGEGNVIMEFSGKELVKGEPDASSFPSGGLRATFEARGYTAWDPTSYAFIRGTTLYIPTAFCAYNGECLDKKTPLLKSMQTLDKQAMRILKLFGNTSVSRVITTVGAEQEYFLIDKDVYEKRLDLQNCGRTLFGAKPPKGQELEDHYFGSIKQRVNEFMMDLDEELWKLGIPSKTKHNEVAPAQHELAPVFATTNIASDHNQLTMEMMRIVAQRHNLVCLLHEKPFNYINGSGKHNNWSISTDTGINLLEPGDTSTTNAQFLLFLTAIIKAVDDYQDLLRISSASAGNDHRLGANEAPPAIISIFLGDELSSLIESVQKGVVYNGKKKVQFEIGANVIPHFSKDTADRNRTSPFAFTGNKFEFRMLGSSMSIADVNIVLNTAVAESLKQFSDKLENAQNFNEELDNLIKEELSLHNRIIFNGDGYSQAWVDEAEKRGLLNLRSTPDTLPYLLSEKNINLFASHNVFSKSEITSRLEIIAENYCKIIKIEASTMSYIIKKDIIPASLDYQKELLEISSKKASLLGFESKSEKSILKKIVELTDNIYSKLTELDNLNSVAINEFNIETAKYFKEKVLANLDETRKFVDELESIISNRFWTLPTYSDILHSVR